MNVTPRTRSYNAVDYSTLKSGSAFLYQGAIWIVVSDSDQGAVRLDNGEYQSCLCGDIVVPVDATLTWKYNKVTPKKKK